jgi:ApbE superfamily uncharacterized protein (UPF0280 family)
MKNRVQNLIPMQNVVREIMIALQRTTLGPMSSIPVELAMIMLEPLRHTRLRIASAAENGAHIYEKHDRIIPTLFSQLGTPSFQMWGIRNLESGVDSCEKP